MQINGKRLLQDLNELRTFGAFETGVIRRAFSEVDIASRKWLIRKLQHAGLRADMDGVGNVLGFAPDTTRALLMGSHTDTQPEGGWLDGAMGVIYALEIARAAREQHGAQYPIDVASWMDEEGCFLTCLGSRSFCGGLPQEEIDGAVNPEGQTLHDAIIAAGLENRLPARLDPFRHIAYLEGHIEQGCVLEALGKRVGVVTSIVGGAAYQIMLSGQQNHAGTTPMSMRRDAGMAFVELAYAINHDFRQIAGPDSVWTIGDVSFKPGAINTIPGHSEFFLEFRDTEKSVIDSMIKCLCERVDHFGKTGNVSVEIRPLGEPLLPAKMSQGVQKHIAEAAQCRASGEWMHLPSGAGHDAALFTDLIPTGMLFIPSIAGVSHSFDENTLDEDIVLGCQVLADAAISYLNSL